MSDRMKTACLGGVAGLIIAVFIFFVFRDPTSNAIDNLFLILFAPIGGFAGGWLGYKTPKDDG